MTFPVIDVPLIRLNIKRPRFVTYEPFVRLLCNHLQTVFFSRLFSLIIDAVIFQFCPLFCPFVFDSILDVLDAKIAHEPQRFFRWFRQVRVHRLPPLQLRPSLLQVQDTPPQSPDFESEKGEPYY